MQETQKQKEDELNNATNTNSYSTYYAWRRHKTIKWNSKVTKMLNCGTIEFLSFVWFIAVFDESTSFKYTLELLSSKWLIFNYFNTILCSFHFTSKHFWFVISGERVKLHSKLISLFQWNRNNILLRGTKVKQRIIAFD